MRHLGVLHFPLVEMLVQDKFFPQYSCQAPLRLGGRDDRMKTTFSSVITLVYDDTLLEFGHFNTLKWGKIAVISINYAVIDNQSSFK